MFLRERTMLGIAALVITTSLACAWADEVTVHFDIQPRALRVGEGAVCSIAVRGMDNPPQPTLPPIDGFQISFAGLERSFSFGSSGSDRAVTFRFRLVPLRAGQFDIGPFMYRINHQAVQLPAVRLNVVAPDQQPHAAQDVSAEDLLFTEVIVSPTNLFSQQVFDLSFHLFAADGINLGRELSILNLPNVGLSIQPLQEMGSDRIVRNNRIYNVRRFTTKATALSAGSFELAPILRVQVLVPRERRRVRDPFWGDFDPFESFFGRVAVQSVDVQVAPLTLTVRPLPEAGRPTSFSGAVGRFDFRVDVKPLKCAVGDPVTINLTILGEGNIENVNAPSIQTSDAWRLYDTKLAAKDINPQRAAGRKVFELVAIPRTEGAVELPPIEFSFFDPEQETYRTIQQGPFVLRVEPATNVTARVVQVTATEKSVSPKVLGTDIVDLKRDVPRRIKKVDDSASPTAMFWALQSVPLFIVLLLGLWRRHQAHLEEDIAYARRTRAPRAARAGLRRAAQALEKADRVAFFEALYATLSDYFGNRLNLPPGAVLSSDVLTRLRAAGLSGEYLNTLEELYGRCEEERYAGASGARDKTQDSAQCRELLKKLEDVLHACERISI